MVSVEVWAIAKMGDDRLCAVTRVCICDHSSRNLRQGCLWGGIGQCGLASWFGRVIFNDV